MSLNIVLTVQQAYNLATQYIHLNETTHHVMNNFEYDEFINYTLGFYVGGFGAFWKNGKITEQ